MRGEPADVVDRATSHDQPHAGQYALWVLPCGGRGPLAAVLPDYPRSESQLAMFAVAEPTRTFSVPPMLRSTPLTIRPCGELICSLRISLMPSRLITVFG